MRHFIFDLNSAMLRVSAIAKPLPLPAKSTMSDAHPQDYQFQQYSEIEETSGLEKERAELTVRKLASFRPIVSNAS